MKAWLRRWAERIWWVISAVSVRTKIMGIVLTMVLLLGLGITIQVRLTMQHLLRQELDRRALATAGELAARSTDMVLTNDLFGLYDLIRDTVEHDPDIRYAFILDLQGEPLVHSFGQGFPPDLLRVNLLAEGETSRLEVLDTEEGLIHDVAAPIFGGAAGTARVGFSERRMQETIATVTQNLLLTTAVISLIGVGAGYLLTWVLTRPLLSLVQATEAVARGDFDRRVDPWADDEIGHLSASFNHMVEELSLAYRELQHKEALRRQLLKQLMNAQEEERRRISLELHDEAGQSLTSLLVGLSALESSSCPEGVKEQVRALRDVAAQTLEAMHNLSGELRPRALDDLGLVTALERYLRCYGRRYGLSVDFQTVGLRDGRLDPDVETALYRIIQEALTNVARHAQASSVSVLLERRGGSLLAIVEDDGQGFDLERLRYPNGEREHLGLYGMEERASMVGGTLTVESAPGGGTTVFVEVPLGQRAEEGDGADSHPDRR